MTSLLLELEASGTAVLLKASELYLVELRQLTPRFRTAVQRGPGIVELELDDLLVNLRELSHWPTEDVEWQPELAALVKDSLQAAVEAEAQLEDRANAREPMSDEELRQALGADWTGELTAFQSRDIIKLLSLRHGANFSVPGAGKTRVGLATFQALRTRGEVQRLLVVCPKAAYESWQFENRTCFSRPLRLQILDGKADPNAELILVNYERLSVNETALAKWLSAEPSVMILDEAHRMKRGTSGVYGAACLALGPRAKRRLILTGTPAPNGVQDIQNLFAFVLPGQGRQAVSRAVAGGDLRYASQTLRPFFARTTKKELDLPPVTTRVRRVELPPLHREIYSALTGIMSVRAAENQSNFDALGRVVMYLLMAATSPALITLGTTKYEPLSYRVPPIEVPAGATLYQLLRDLPDHEMSPKYKEALSIVASNAESGRKTIVWSTFVRSLTTMSAMFARFQPATVHGGTPDREDQIKRFREDPDCLVLLSNPATLGEGISLHQVCHDAVYVDRDFAAGRYLQSLDRIHRLGLQRKTTTNVTILASEGTIDELVEQRLETKLRFMGSILDDPEVEQLADLEEEPAVGGVMDMADIRALLGYLDDPINP
ncbi:DNA helicase [Sphaerisporangium melleum]|uniref:DNA helicase n=1 Tax=Sphaerisporangium melleum TaxID=321316 RepID=A0A917QZZ1_9ACTN|nr:DEAD/DEAH box helicase [Sphaerisporangium melleum]GGK78289.1 DNA helicase [Sphaerisporangium melleum]GII69834.1 DNA helicase [Sphaerisporangium melleum]